MPEYVKLPWVSTAAILAVLGAIFGAWLFVDGYFAKDAALKAVQTEALITTWTFEESQNALRMDIIEDRVWREKKQPDSDMVQIQRWTSQITDLERRQAAIKANKEKLAISQVTNGN